MKRGWSTKTNGPTFRKSGKEGSEWEKNSKYSFDPKIKIITFSLPLFLDSNPAFLLKKNVRIKLNYFRLYGFE